MQVETAGDSIVYFNGRFVALRDARIGILTHALHYGTGVFEGIRAYWDEIRGELFGVRMLDHFERWKKNCGILRITVPLSAEELCAIAVELLRKNRLRADIYIRPIAYKSAERIGVAPDDEDAFAIVALPFGAYLHAEKGIHAGVSSWRRVEDNAIPARGKICGAYVNSVLATDEAHQGGFDEAILLNESGHVAEGATCNIFMIRDGKLITPPVYENVLEGITRDAVMQLSHRELGIDIVERPIDRSELFVCDELFFSGTAVGIAPIVRVNHRPVCNGTIGAMTRSIGALYSDAVHGRLGDYSHWLTPVYERDGNRDRDLTSTSVLG
jgi:branched-chain amino acid aminotransferase